MKARFILFLVVFYFLSCSDTAQADAHLYESDNAVGFKQDVDISDTYFLLASEWSDKLSFSNIQNGTSDFEIRFWVNGEIMYNKAVYVIRYRAGEWTGKYYRFRTDSNSVESISINPKSGWDQFEKRLLDLHVKQLPNFSSTGLGGLYDDGTTYMMEIGEPSSYRFSWYSNPAEYAGRSKDAQLWKDVANLFKNEFEVSY